MSVINKIKKVGKKAIGSSQYFENHCKLPFLANCQLKVLSLLVILMLSLFSFASEPLVDSANAAYSKNQFEKAAADYETVLAKGYESAELYYNLGNAYFKMNKIGLSIVNYERAKRLSANDEDILFNLKMVSQKLQDKIEPTSDFILKEWFNGFLNVFSEKGWSILCITLLILALGAFGIYFLSRQTGLRKLGFWLGSILIIFCATTFLIAMKSGSASQTHNEAVVIAPSLNVKSSPTEEGTNLFILHEGTKIKVNQINGDWMEIKIPTGTGWAFAKDLVII